MFELNIEKTPQKQGYLKQTSEGKGELLWQMGEVPLSQAVPLISVSCKWSSASCQQHREAQSEDVRHWKMGVILVGDEMADINTRNTVSFCCFP